MPARPRQDEQPYFSRVRRYILDGGERFATVVDSDNVPAYYPTAFALWRRTTVSSNETLVADAEDLVHIGLWAALKNIDLNGQMDRGRHLDMVDVRTLADACALSTRVVRRRLADRRAGIRRIPSRKPDTPVANGRKNRRLITAAKYLDHIAQFAESGLASGDPELSRRKEAREAMTAEILKHLARVRASRVRGVVPAARLTEVVAFIASADPLKVRKSKAIARRNWLLIHLLATYGLRQGEARQLKTTDIDMMRNTLAVDRRHDDPEDLRVREPNAKTFDRIIPFFHHLAPVLDAYLLGPGSDAAARRGSLFLLLTHDNRTFGTAIGSDVAARAVRELGEHLGIDGLTPRQLRHGWIQKFARWAIASGISTDEFKRFANYLGGWSQLSDMANEYRADQLTEAAYAAGLKIQEARG